ncbi:hypothetical protein [Motiliproteus sp. SC1-56]|uniref:hypothetical protein n=1 Tax=Motiliproteus sp. SC1-56 TaxID=2799565 RepID=UPI001A8D6ABB|nr:hypothetical protein [Motiliproteus sp. SC1-56]
MAVTIMRSVAFGLCLWLGGLVLPATASTMDADTAAASARELVERWLELQHQRTTQIDGYRTLVVERGWEIQLVEGEARSFAQLEALLGQRFDGLSASRYRIAYFKTAPRGNGLLRVWVELDWQGTQDDGLAAVARLDVELTLGEMPDGQLRIRRLSERYLAPLQGNGARIKC